MTKLTKAQISNYLKSIEVRPVDARVNLLFNFQNHLAQFQATPDNEDEDTSREEWFKSCLD